MNGRKQTFAASAKSKVRSKNAVAQSINQFFPCTNAANRSTEQTLPKIGTAATTTFGFFGLDYKKNQEKISLQ
jgi:hypothetical protein